MFRRIADSGTQSNFIPYTLEHDGDTFSGPVGDTDTGLDNTFPAPPIPGTGLGTSEVYVIEAGLHGGYFVPEDGYSDVVIVTVDF